MRNLPITSRDAERAAHLYEKSLSIGEIVDQIGYSFSTIRGALHRGGVAMRPKGIKRGPEIRGK
jgi:hypothetical protein